MGLLTATLNYYKGYKVNTRILHSIEKFSGYNKKSIPDIDRIVSGLGYTTEIANCPTERKNAVLVSQDKSYCVYYYKEDSLKKNSEDKPQHYSYGVTTYISVDLPIVGKFRVPVYTKGERIYRFKGSCQVGADCN